MKRLWAWLRDYWALPFMAVAAGVAWLFRRKVGDGVLKTELAVIAAGREARKMHAQLGYQEAINHVRDRYEHAYDQLLARNTRETVTLERDPVALAKRLERISRNGFRARPSVQTGSGEPWGVDDTGVLRRSRPRRDTRRERFKKR